MMQQPIASHFVDGAYLEDTSGTKIDVIYPGTGAKIATVYSATPAVIDAALNSAARAQKTWAALSGTQRGQVLLRAAELIRADNYALSVLETYDTGKPLQETLVADATSGAEALAYFGGLAASITGEYIPLADGDFVYTSREPIGVCAGIGAWNYPTQIACWKAAPALACGNALVFKPSEMTPLCALKIAEIMMEAGAPAGLFNVIQGLGDVGATLASDSRVDKVSLTGSVPTGRKVYSSAAAHMKHVTMELGGKSPILIFDDADIEAAVGGAILGNFYSSGQVCSNGTRVFVQKGIKDAFLARLKERLKGVVMGDPLDEAVNFGPMVSERQAEIVEGYIARGMAGGATLFAGGSRNGFTIAPTVFTDVTDDMVIAKEEIFGPVMAVLDFETEEEGLRRANATEFGLSAAVFTRDLARGHRVAAALEAGTCWINTYNLAPVEAPFGGVKASGVGRENSKEAIHHYTQVKSVYVAAGGVDAPY
ncbi:betaine-aldehyde dehydrogenase [Falsihalocynthiibacter arcticus]|uniref:Betaine-aldehyde dehydrogenase n=1 Tax=Falsihalocynthiibacter arcticus TaxID=1579316 RepID=A0A126UV88_9RHOB|nr:betaine-aldehyde dehydrogenase [Falsihalocynthiibacter arcticus]AML50003.1 betaine-aldehyde dehydrogenase [Falsihalocynthiibacter arcticus]